MASSQLGAYTGGSRRSGHHAQRSAAAAAAAAKQLLSRLRSSLRSGAARPRQRAPVNFGYDLQSYSQNFDDGIGSAGHPLSVIPAVYLAASVILLIPGD